MNRSRRLVAGTLAAASIAILVAAAVRFAAVGTSTGVWSQWSFAMAFVVVGALLTSKRPDHTVGWIVAVTGLASAILAAGAAATDGGLGIYVLWAGSWLWVVSGVLPGIILPLVFPTGQVLSPRWRIAVWAGFVGMVLVCVVQALVSFEKAGVSTQAENPFRLAAAEPLLENVALPVGALLLFGALLAAIVSSILRYRRSHGDERQQLRWVMTAFVTAAALYIVPSALPVRGVILDVFFAVGMVLIPVSIGVAILRYRLYDIGRIVSRTVTYALVTGIVVAIYTGVVLLAQRMLGPDDAPDLVVAGGTLSAAALFRPLLVRVGRVVDARFNRRRYDAAEEVRRFARRVRDEFEVDRLSADLAGVAREALQPTTVGVWLPPNGSSAVGSVTKS